MTEQPPYGQVPYTPKRQHTALRALGWVTAVLILSVLPVLFLMTIFGTIRL